MQTENEPFERKFTYWLYIISPSIIAAAILMYEIIDNYNNLGTSRGWSLLGMLIGIPVFILIIVFDLMAKEMLKKTSHLWLFEIGMLLLMFFIIKVFA